jgi:hypothetical protein
MFCAVVGAITTATHATTSSATDRRMGELFDGTYMRALSRDHVAAHADASHIRDTSVAIFGKDGDEAPQTSEKMGWLTGLEPATTGITIRNAIVTFQ